MVIYHHISLQAAFFIDAENYLDNHPLVTQDNKMYVMGFITPLSICISYNKNVF